MRNQTINSPSSTSTLTTPRGRDKTWVRAPRSTKSEHASSHQNSRIQKWVQNIHQGMRVTPDPETISNPEFLPANFHSNHFQVASKQLTTNLATSPAPLPPIKKNHRAWQWPLFLFLVNFLCFSIISIFILIRNVFFYNKFLYSIFLVNFLIIF